MESRSIYEEITNLNLLHHLSYPGFIFASTQLFYLESLNSTGEEMRTERNLALS